jgi:hypothetical protein
MTAEDQIQFILDIAAHAQREMIEEIRSQGPLDNLLIRFLAACTHAMRETKQGANP